MKRIALLLALLIPCVARADVQVGAGSTSQCFDVFVNDSSVSTGAGKTGLAYNTASLTCYYKRRGASSATAITLATSTLGTYTSGAFKEVDGTNMPGWYEFCPPDAALATGAADVAFQCKGATNMAPMNLRVTLLSPNTYGYDGKLAAESGTTLTLATGAIDADNQFAYTAEVAFFDSAGLLEAVSCITASANTGDTVTTAEDISALIAVNDNYVVRANSACRNLRATTAGNTLDVHANGDAEANVTKIDGQVTTGNNATLNLKQLNVVNNAGDAIVASSTGSNGNGVNASGNGTGSGVLATGGATGRGVYGKGGATSGAGIRAEGMGGNSAGFYGIGIGSSPGMDLIGGATNANGLVATGQGSGSGFRGVAGATGNGAQFVGGSTSGDGIDTSVTSGSGVDATLSALTATYAEPSGCITWPATLPDMLRFLVALARHKLVQNSTTFTVYKDDGVTTLCVSAITNSGGVFTRPELN